MDGGFVAAALGRRDGGSADGVHLMWTAPPGSAAALDGWRIQRRDATGRPKVTCRELTDTELAVLHRVLRLSLDIADIAVRQVSHPDAGVTDLASTQPPARPIAYRIRLPEPHRVVEIHAGVAQAQVIALRDGKAVAMRVLADPSGTQHARFDELGTDEVQIYTTAPVSALTLCLDVSPRRRRRPNGRRPRCWPITCRSRSANSIRRSRPDPTSEHRPRAGCCRAR